MFTDLQSVPQGVTRPKGCRMSIIEAVWRPDLVQESATPAAVTDASTTAELEAPTTETLAEQLKVEELTLEDQETKWRASANSMLE